MSQLSSLLVIRAQLGDRDALNQVLTELQAPLYAHIVGVMGQPDGADDVLQDVLWIIARKLGTVRHPEWTRAWAYRIANREAIRAARTVNADEPFDAERHSEVPVEPSPETSDIVADLPVMLGSLPAASQAVIRMHYMDGLALAEIAEALEIPLGTVKSRLSYGLGRLRALSGVNDTRT